MLERIKEKAISVFKPNINQELGLDKDGNKLLLTTVGAGEERVTIESKELKKLLEDYLEVELLEYDVNEVNDIYRIILNHLLEKKIPYKSVSIITSDLIKNIISSDAFAGEDFKNFDVKSIVCFSNIKSETWEASYHNGLPLRSFSADIYIDGNLKVKVRPF